MISYCTQPRNIIPTFKHPLNIRKLTISKVAKNYLPSAYIKKNLKKCPWNLKNKKLVR